VNAQGFLHPVSSSPVPSFSNCVARSKDRFSSSSRSMVKSPFPTVPASDGRPASLMKASYDYVEFSLAQLSVRQAKAERDTNLIVAVRLQEASHHGRSRVFDRHVCLSCYCTDLSQVCVHYQQQARAAITCFCEEMPARFQPYRRHVISHSSLRTTHQERDRRPAIIILPYDS
jgi:hypothetical protein